MNELSVVLAQVGAAQQPDGLQWWEGLLGGLAGVIVMTMMMRMAGAAGMTEMRMPAMLGSMFTADAERAKPLGMGLHVMNGAVFGFVYALIWWAFEFDVDNAWWIGAIFGAVHGLVMVVMMPAMSAMHPRVEEHRTEPRYEGTLALPPFGFGGRGFGPRTPMGIVVNHVLFGVVWGLLFWALVG